MIKNWDLIKELTWTDFKLRYNRSILGFLWSFLKPLSMLIVLYVIFSLIFNVKMANYSSFLFLGIILWNFFSESTSISMSNMLAKRSIIKNIYFPRKILIINSCLNALITLVINLSIFLIIILITNLKVSLIQLSMLLFLVFLLFIISLGVSYVLASYYVKYRDLVHIWDVFLQIGFFVTPITYNVDIIPKNYLFVYLLNPLASILSYSREIVLNNKYPNFLDIIILIAISALVYFSGSYFFKKRSKYFAEEL